MELILKNDLLEAIVTTHGAELISLKDSSGKEYIWSGDPAFWSGRNPVLFPIVGNLKKGTIQMDDVFYSMGRHGFARNSEFQVVDQTEDSVVFELRENAETLTQYPRCFVLQVCHRLEKDGFSTIFKVKNADEKDMPFCIGAHTAFRCPLNENENFEDYEIVFDQEEYAYNLVLNDQGCIRGAAETPMLDHTDHLALGYEPFAELDTLIFRNLNSTGVSLKHSTNGHGIHMEFSGFPFMAFWTKGAEHAPFLCVEPWHGCAATEDETGEFEDKEACILLKPNESKEFIYTVSILS